MLLIEFGFPSKEKIAYISHKSLYSPCCDFQVICVNFILYWPYTVG